MMKAYFFAGALCLFAIATIGAEPVASTAPAGYSYEVLNLRTGSDVYCGSEQNRKSSYWAEFNLGEFKVVKDADVVAVEQYLVPVSASDAGGKDLYDMNSRRATNPTYTPIHTKSSDKVKLQTTGLLQNAYLVKTMRVQADAVIAKKREEKAFDVRAMEDPSPVAEGLFIRITNINMSVKRELTVVVHYSRRAAGTRAPFLEAVYARDTEGKEVGGDRWMTGDAFGVSGDLTFKFVLRGDQIHKSLRLVAVTDNVLETVVFDISGVFQK